MTDGSGNLTSGATSLGTAGPPATDLPRWTPILIGLLFFASGMSGLIYEVIWTRVLLSVFGATIYAVSTVLAAFMGGLALGSVAGGRLADRLRRPLAAYGVLEIVVAATALAVPWALDLFDPLYRTLYGSGDAAMVGGPSFFSLSLVRFAVSFLVLLVPTTCMGATLPVMARFLVRRSGRQGSRIGGLYAANTTGAVTGTFLAGFVLIAGLGVHGSVLTAALISTAVGLVAIGLSLGLERHPVVSGAGADTTAGSGSQETAPADATPAWLARLVMATYAGSGFAALALQVLWTRTLVFRFDVLKNTTYSFSAMLTVFLVGLAAGSAVMTRLVDRQRDPVRLYGLLQVLTGLTAALSLVMLVTVAGVLELPGTYDAQGGFSWLHAVGNVLLRTSATILLPTLLMGMAFPLAARMVVRRLDRVGASTGRLYAWNTLGAILGSFSAGFLLIPALGLARGLLLSGAVYVVLGTVVLVAAPDQARIARLGWASLGVALVVLLAVASPGQAPFQQVFPGHRIVVDDEG
jgi:spermidine synthase